MPKKLYCNYHIAEPDPDKQEILIAHLTDFGFDGFEQNDGAVIASALLTAIDSDKVQIFLRSQKLNFKLETIEDQNWNAQWEQSFQPIVVESFCTVRAAFHQPVKGIAYDIIITPKMSFGTGHHATTYMMLQAMQQINFLEKFVIDFGTGTGILAILAEKMGAKKVDAIDHDDWCIENGQENIQANSCCYINLIQADNLDTVLPADVILANINKHVILSALPAMKLRLNSNGVLVLSGILRNDEQDIVEASLQNGFRKRNILEKNGWLCICLGLI